MGQAWILSGARVIDPAQGLDDSVDIGITPEGILTDPVTLPRARRLDLSGKVLVAGLIDLHVHLRDPGQTHKEDLVTGTAAAAAGGFTTVVAMPNTSPPMDSPDTVRAFLDRARTSARVRVLQTATLTEGREGKVLTDACALRDAGAVALTDDGSCIQQDGLALEALKGARGAGLPYMEHCESESVVADGVLTEGCVADSLGLPGQPGIAEELVVARDAVLAGYTGWSVHMQHLSCAESVTRIRQARERGIPVTAEVAPHHLFLTVDACRHHGANAKMNPPLRHERDCLALLAGLQDGTIDAIASDHAPHTTDEKAGGLLEAPFGIAGLEAMLPLCLTRLYHADLLPLGALVRAFTVGPAQVLNRPTGTLELGRPADITVVDLDAQHVLDPDTWRSRGHNCPYGGTACRGKAVGTMVRGRWVFSELDGIPSLV